MIMNIQQNGLSYELPLALDCFNPKCTGEYKLITSFPNDQELWQCNKCKNRYFAYVSEAKFQFVTVKDANLAAAGEVDDHNPTLRAPEMGEAVSKNCLYCHMPFLTYDCKDDLCESCGYAEHLGWKN